MFKSATIQTVTTTATAFVGTAFFALACVGIANPARADAPAGFRQTVEAGIDKALVFPAAGNAREGVVTVAVTLAADGTVREAEVARTSGTEAFDREALRVAQTIAYPATGAPRTVAMVIGFGKRATLHEAQQGKAIVEARRDDNRRLLATETTARPVG